MMNDRDIQEIRDAIAKYPFTTAQVCNRLIEEIQRLRRVVAVQVSLIGRHGMKIDELQQRLEGERDGISK